MYNTYKALARRVEALDRGDIVEIGKTCYWVETNDKGFRVIISRQIGDLDALEFEEAGFEMLKRHAAHLKEKGII